MHIVVTEDHIKAAKRHDCCHCPVALAIKDLTGDTRVSVGYNTWMVNAQWGNIPDDVSDIIMKYDKTGQMDPFDFYSTPRGHD